MFGRRKQQQEEAAREAERRALFEQLAKRPDTVCPFLGLENARTEVRDRVSDGHRCYAFGDPAELSAEQQQKVCLQRGYGNCPRYLRGVLVIPTEELEALRHPQPAPPPPPPPGPGPAAAGAGGGNGRGLLVAVVVLLLVLGGGGAAFFAFSGPGPVARETPTPSPMASGSAPASPTTSATAGPSATTMPTPSPTPVAVPSSGALPTPGPGDTPTGYAVRVQAGQYVVVEMEGDGSILGPAQANFDNVSWAPVQRVVVDGDIYWRTLQGGYTGRAYSTGLQPGFTIFQTYENDAGEPRFRELDAGEY